MNVTLSLDEGLVRKIRKIAAEHDTTLTALIRTSLETIAAEDTAYGRGRRERESLDRSFERLRVKVGKRTWTRADLHARP